MPNAVKETRALTKPDVAIYPLQGYLKSHSQLVNYTSVVLPPGKSRTLFHVVRPPSDVCTFLPNFDFNYLSRTCKTFYSFQIILLGIQIPFKIQVPSIHTGLVPLDEITKNVL